MMELIFYIARAILICILKFAKAYHEVHRSQTIDADGVVGHVKAMRVCRKMNMRTTVLGRLSNRGGEQ